MEAKVSIGERMSRGDIEQRSRDRYLWQGQAIRLVDFEVHAPRIIGLRLADRHVGFITIGRKAGFPRRG